MAAARFRAVGKIAMALITRLVLWNQPYGAMFRFNPKQGTGD